MSLRIRQLADEESRIMRSEVKDPRLKGKKVKRLMAHAKRDTNTDAAGIENLAQPDSFSL